MRGRGPRLAFLFLTLMLAGCGGVRANVEGGSSSDPKWRVFVPI